MVGLSDRMHTWDKTESSSGITHDELLADPHLVTRCSQLIALAGKKLAEARMIAFDTHSEAFTITDLGRIAAKYYIKHTSIEVFNKEFRPRMTEADVLAILSKSTEVRAFC
jgi:antiviral helicase SLH1